MTKKTMFHSRKTNLLGLRGSLAAVALVLVTGNLAPAPASAAEASDEISGNSKSPAVPRGPVMSGGDTTASADGAGSSTHDPARAAPQGPPMPNLETIARPSFPGEFPLYPASASAKSEELWETGFGSRTVRNVAVPTLIPVLPAPGKANGTAVIVAPGGAWMFLMIDSEGLQVAQRLADRGVSAFVLKYRLAPTDPKPKAFLGHMFASLGVLMKDRDTGSDNATFAGIDDAVSDARAAVALVRTRAGQWDIAPDRIGLIGFSAGATTTAKLAVSNIASGRPDFVGVMYGPVDVGPVPATAPPLFAASALDDQFVKVRNGGLLESWTRAGRPVEAHFYEKGGHGFTAGTAAKMWFDEFWAWMETRGLIKSAPPEKQGQ